MGSIIGEAKHLENGDSSLLIPPPKYKRRKVSAVRDFPRGCGPNAVPVCTQTKAKVVQGVDALNVDDVLKEVLKDIESCGEKGVDLCESERKGLPEQNVQPDCLNGVELAASTLATCSNVKSKNEELENLFAENTNTSGEIQNLKEKPILRDEKQDSSNELMETSNNSGLVDFKELANKKLEEGINVEQNLLPHHPIPPNLVRKDRKYPPPRKVSAVRNFPAGCGPNLTSLEGNKNCEDKIQGNVLKTTILGQSSEIKSPMKSFQNLTKGPMKSKPNLTSLEGSHEKLSESDEGVAVKMIMKAPMLGQSSEIKSKEENLEYNNDEQHMQDMELSGYSRKGDIDIGKNEIMVYEKDKDKKKKSVGKTIKNIELQEESSSDIKIDKKKMSFGKSIKNMELQEESSSEIEIEKGIIVQGLMSAASSPWRLGKGPANLSPFPVSAKERKGKKRPLIKGKDSSEKVAENSMMIVPYLKEMETDEVSRPLTLSDGGDSSENEEQNDFQFLPRPRDCDVTLPPFMVGSSSEKGSRSKVRETLRLFQVLVRKILQGEEAKSKEKGKSSKRVDIQASFMLKAKGKYINTEKVIGAVPGVEIGDIFSYRVELAVIGLHTPLQSGIDTIKLGKRSIAISVVASGGYDNDVDNPDVLIYTGQGGNPTGPDKQPEDQKLERGNLALKNCLDKKSPVRVIRGFRETKPSDNGDGRSKTVATYTYDGLYTLERYWPEVGPHGKLVFKFELRRIPGQHQLAWKEVKQSKNCQVREGFCVDDISKGKEKPPICAINTIDDEKPATFTYITSMMYPDWCRPIPFTGCHCKNACSDSDRCACAVKNGGEIPYNLSGAIVDAKPLVYECGPSCKCPPSCSNRVSQHGIKLPLEIFKTRSRGWGVRCVSSIPSGSFICEYIGELLDDKEAEQRVGSDEYLFDIGQNYNDPTLSDGLSALMPDMPSIAGDVVENVGFTIDAARYGNIGRFINHSCTPNLYAQNVLYDYEDKRIPHIMMFAAENIPPLQELTYHYNYTIDQVFDSNGNIKKKNCYCGSAECSGRMY